MWDQRYSPGSWVGHWNGGKRSAPVKTTCYTGDYSALMTSQLILFGLFPFWLFSRKKSWPFCAPEGKMLFFTWFPGSFGKAVMLSLRVMQQFLKVLPFANDAFKVSVPILFFQSLSWQSPVRLARLWQRYLIIISPAVSSTRTPAGLSLNCPHFQQRYLSRVYVNEEDEVLLLVWDLPHRTDLFW